MHEFRHRPELSATAIVLCHTTIVLYQSPSPRPSLSIAENGLVVLTLLHNLSLTAHIYHPTHVEVTMRRSQKKNRSDSEPSPSFSSSRSSGEEKEWIRILAQLFSPSPLSPPLLKERRSFGKKEERRRKEISSSLILILSPSPFF